MSVIDYLPVLAAFGVVAGMLAFLAYCSRELDAEARKVERRSPR